MKDNTQYQFTSAIVRPGRGNGQRYYCQAGLKQRSMLTAQGFEEEFLHSHPKTGEFALEVYHRVMAYLRKETSGTVPAMLNHITTKGITEDLERLLHWCEDLAAVRDSPRPNGELALLERLLPKGVYGALEQRYGLVMFESTA
jgi:hypothetical protein